MQEPVDFGALVALLLVTVTSKEVAHAVGPYASIVVAAIAGAGFALTRAEAVMGTTKGTLYVIVRVFAALVLTVPAANLLQDYYATAKVTWTIAPIAFALGMVDGDWVWGMLKRLKNIRLALGNKK